MTKQTESKKRRRLEAQRAKGATGTQNAAADQPKPETDDADEAKRIRKQARREEKESRAKAESATEAKQSNVRAIKKVVAVDDEIEAKRAPMGTKRADLYRLADWHEAEAKRLRKKARRADVDSQEEEPASQVDDVAEAKRHRKAAKRAEREIQDSGEIPPDSLSAGSAEAKHSRQKSKDAEKQDLERRAAPGANKEPKKVPPTIATDELKKRGDQSRDELQVFIGGLPFSCEEACLRKDFGKCGEIRKLNMPLESDGSSRGIAFITFATMDGVNAMLEFDGKQYNGRTLKVNQAGAFTLQFARSKTKRGITGNTEFTMFIRGLSYSCTEEELRKDFGECGEILDLKSPKDEEGTSKGFAFITFADKLACDKALEWDQQEYGGRRLSVKMASDTADKGKGKGAKSKGKSLGKKGKSKGKGKATPEEIPNARSGRIVNFEGKKQRLDESDDDDE